MGSFEKRHICYCDKTERVYSVTQHVVGLTVNKQVKAKILAKRNNVPLQHIKHSKSWDRLLRHVKEWSEKVKQRISWVQLKHQRAPTRETYFVRTSGKEAEQLEPILCEFMA